MQFSHLHNKFARMGARVMVEPVRDLWRESSAVRLDVQRDHRGEYFHLMADPLRVMSLDVLDLSPAQRHLLLMVRQRQFGRMAEAPKQRFLCGHDERAWFVAAVPEKAAAASVNAALEALKPRAVLDAQERAGLRQRERHRRRNRAFVRQGEWFFIPRPDLKVDERLALRNEPMRRGEGKPHWAELAYREGGELVYVSHFVPNGLTLDELKAWRERNPKLRDLARWTPMRRNARLYVRGRIRHPDHKTIVLNGWHEVQMNTESQAQAMRNVAFLD